MIPQAKIKNLSKAFGFLRGKGYPSRTAYAALLVSFTFISDTHASQRRLQFSTFDEGFGRPLQEIEHHPNRNQGEYGRNNKRDVPIYSPRSSFNTRLSQMQISSPLPTLDLMQTPQGIIRQYHSPAPEISSFPFSFQLSVENEFYRTAVGNQLQLGTCASFAVVDGLLYVHGKPLSPAYLNVKAKSQYALDCSNNGLDIGFAMRSALDYGTVMDWVWPYKGYYAEVEAANKNISNKPQPNWDVCAQSPYTDDQDKGLVKFAFGEIKSLFLKNTGNAKDLLIKDALVAYKAPVVISIPVQWNKEWSPNLQTTGKIKTSPQSIDGWHAVSICGFNERTKEFTFKNSWGLEWGNQGFGTMAYSYVMDHASEAWIGYGKQLKS